MPAKEAPVVELVVPRYQQTRLTVLLMGTSPLIMHAMSAKAKRELLKPRGKLNAADKKVTQKHNPLDEFHDCAYINNGQSLTHFGMPSAALKRALCSAALDVRGLFKSQIGRLVWVEDEYCELFGVPELYMTTVRMADAAKTPDIRTFMIFPRWQMFATIRYDAELLQASSIVNLLTRAGQTVGIGDGRPEKGKLNFGMFVPQEDSPEHTEWRTLNQRDAQLVALDNPTFYDQSTKELYQWWEEQSSKN